MENKINVQTFNSLVSVIRKEIEEGRIYLERDVENRKTTVMWRIGSHIHSHILQHQEKADYGDYLFDKLSEELGIGKRTLYRTVKFYKEYPEIVTALSQLPWAHYTILLTVEDKIKRDTLKNIAVNKKLSYRQLQELVRKEKTQAPQKPVKELTAVRGRPGIYRLKIIDGIMNLDCGFYSYIEKSGMKIEGYEEKSIEYTEGYEKITKLDKNMLYIFKAKIAEVVDGDTVKAYIYNEYPFNKHKKMLLTLRLRGINAEDLQTEKGAAAKKYVESEILNLPVVVIKTHSRDVYLRYLADVFYLTGSTDVYEITERGNYLNSELIDEGLAERFRRW